MQRERREFFPDHAGKGSPPLELGGGNGAPLDVGGTLVLPLEWRRVCRGTFDLQHSTVVTQGFFSQPLMLLLLSRFRRVRLCYPIEGSPPGSPIPGILQAGTLEWVAISVSNA